MSEAADRVRKLRQEHFGPRPRSTEPVTVDAPLLHSERGSGADVERAKYEMELGAHRDTLDRLLAEKDETIRTLREHLEDTRTRLSAAEAEAAMSQFDPKS